MGNKFTEAMASRTDSELIAIVTEGKDDYQTEAFEAAKIELTKRNLSSSDYNVAVTEYENDKQIKSEKANQPLGFGQKLFALFIPGFGLFVSAGSLKGDGYDRKAKDLTTWTFYGFAFYIVLILIIFILNRI